MTRIKRWCLIMLLIISGVTIIDPNNESEARESMNMLTNHINGNTAGNIINNGFITEQAGWVYFCDYNFSKHRYGLYKMRIDGTERVKLSNDDADFINIHGEWLYFRSLRDYKLYKIQINGKKRTRICNDQSGLVYLVDQWLYYKNVSDNKLYKIKVDENKKIKLNDDEIGIFNVDGESIYYLNRSDNEFLYRIGIDGLNKTKISDEEIITFIKASDWIYFKGGKNFRKFYKIDICGNNKDEFEVDISVFFNVHKETIIYSLQSSNKRGLYKLNINGGKSEKINTPLPDENNIDEINIINDWIYFRKVVKAYENSKALALIIYRIKIDGTEFERITP